MRVLFVDDSSQRQERFKRSRIGSVLVQAFTYDQAVRALVENPVFDEAHLDHDLSDAAAAGKPAPDEKTGTDIARFICTLPADKRPRALILHSYNFAGRTRMAQILQDAGMHPVITPYSLLG
jgi:hypothetical protein